MRALGYDERFVRTWEFYLAFCEAAFRVRALHDYQLVLTRPFNERLPTSRRPHHLLTCRMRRMPARKAGRGAAWGDASRPGMMRAGRAIPMRAGHGGRTARASRIG